MLKSARMTMHPVALQPSSLQLTIRLTPELSRDLELAARRLQRRRSDVVRLALQRFLASPEPPLTNPADRVAHLIGSLESGEPDLLENQRQKVLEAILHDR